MSALRVPIEVDPGPGVAELFDLEVPFKKPVDLFIGGVGDGRHLFSTIIDFGLQLDDLSETKIDGSENMHITTVRTLWPIPTRCSRCFSTGRHLASLDGAAARHFLSPLESCDRVSD